MSLSLVCHLCLSNNFVKMQGPNWLPADALNPGDASYTTANQYIQQMNHQLSIGSTNIQSLQGESSDVLLGGQNKGEARSAIASTYVGIVKVRFCLYIDDKLSTCICR